MEPTEIQMPPSPYHALADFLGLPVACLGGPNAGLPEAELTDLWLRLASARVQAGISGPELRRLDRTALVAFCVRYGFSRLEVRTALNVAQVALAIRRASRTSDRLIRMRQSLGHREEIYQ